jgi:hypothetical protein
MLRISPIMSDTVPPRKGKVTFRLGWGFCGARDMRGTSLRSRPWPYATLTVDLFNAKHVVVEQGYKQGLQAWHREKPVLVNIGIFTHENTCVNQRRAFPFSVLTKVVF